MASSNQLKQLGYKFLYKPGEGVFAYRDGTSNSPGFVRLRKETKASVEAAGYEVETVDSLNEYASMKGMDSPGGDVDSLAKLNQAADKFIEQLKVGMSRTTEDGTKIGIGNRDFDRATAEAIVGDKVPFSEQALAEQYAAGEAQAKAKDAEVAAAQQPQTQAERAGRIPTLIFDNGAGFEILDSRIVSQEMKNNWEKLISEGKANEVKVPPGAVLDSINYEGPNASSKDVARAEALARQNQISTGSTPQLSGRPDLFAIQPTQAEIDAGIKPIVPQAGMAPVDPMVASTGDILGVQQGTLPTPAAEQAATQVQIQQPGDGSQGAGTGSTGTTGSSPDGSSVGSALESGKDFANYSDLPEWIRNSPDWAALSDEYKKALYFTYHAQQLTNEGAKIDAMAALKEAEKLADPSFQEALRISQDELMRGVSSMKGDFESKKTTLEDRIKNIQEDLLYNRGELDLSQQADLAQQAQKYKSDLLSLQQSAAESGLAFSSPRTTAEASLSSQNEGLVTSTQRRYNQAQRQLATESARGTTETQQGLTDLQRQYQENLTNLQRQGETTMGTSNVGVVFGPDGLPVRQLTGVTGSLAEKKQADVLNLQNVLKERQNPFNFNV